MTLVYDGRGSGFVLANPERKIGNRVSKTVAGVTTTYLVDTLNPTGYAQVVYETFSGSSAPNRELNHVYVYGLELLGQTRNYVANSQSNTQQIYYDYDGHGSVRALSDPNGNVTDTYDYDAFGNLIHSTGSTPNLYLFAGEQFDPDLNLYYNRARYLNTSTGRFWTMDSSEGDAESPFSLHKYLYASADPIDRIDPSGHEDLASLSIGSAIGNTLNNLTAIQGQGIINQIEYGGSSGLATLLLGSFTPIALEGATALASSFAAKLLQSPITRDLLDRALPIIQKLCFAQGTLIVTRRGNTPIEQIKVGDEVLSKNLKTGALEYKKVSRLLPSGHSRVLVISLKDEISIEVTSGHLLFAKRQSNSGGWAMAGQLKVGDSLFDKEGQFILIEKIEQRRDEVSVFNFEVDGNHDYFVSERGILAHNGCEALRAIAESAASKFGILECVPCAEAIKDAFQANGIVGKVIELTPKSEDAELIVSDFVPAQAISTNGRHVAVEVDGIIFDNITPNGIARADGKRPFQQEQVVLMSPSMSLRNHSKLQNSILARLEASPSDYLPEISATLLRHFLRAYFSRLRSNGLDDPGQSLIFNFTEWIQQKYGVDRSYHGSAEIVDSYSSGNEDAFRNFLSILAEFAEQPGAFESPVVDKTREIMAVPKEQGFSELIQDLRTRPALYLGFSTFRGLAAYLQGHIVAADEHNLTRDAQEIAFNGFKRWVEEKKNKGTPRNWYRLVLYMSITDCDHVDSGAARTFFAWYDEYKTQG